MSRVGIIVLLGLAASCGQPGTGSPDGPTDGADAAPGAGLSLAFAIDPQVPGTVFPGVTLDSVDLSIKDLRLTGDAASSADERTRAAFLAISWRMGHEPFPATFPQAPAGLYSKIAFKLENDSGNGFTMRGTVMWKNESHRFEIEYENAVSVDVPMNVVLPAGGSASDTLTVHMLGALAAIDWSSATLEADGSLHLENDPGLGVRMSAAFTAASTSPH